MKRFLNSVLCMCIAVFCTHAQKKNVTSVLEVMDITTGQRSVVKEFPFLIEAPNWTPDGNWLVYNSGGKLYKLSPESPGFDVYVIPALGGEEKRLTTAEGLDDGPEYSPCGQYIWFNSVRTGLMQVWRMKADGSEQTQMTFDETRNSWFPHISPDGKQIVFITYTKGDLEPGQHLANKNVELRLMPAEGGEPKTLVKLFGGQGTINVNSWAPDSKRFAFVSYRLN